MGEGIKRTMNCEEVCLKFVNPLYNICMLFCFFPCHFREHWISEKQIAQFIKQCFCKLYTVGECASGGFVP